MGLIVIAAEHPVLGHLYRMHIDDRQNNAPDVYALTTALTAATTIVDDWRERPDLRLRMGERFIHRALACTGSTDERMCGSLLKIQEQSQQSPYEFFCWLHCAVWQELPAPSGLVNPISWP